MAIQISGTTVIDNSRNLTNIANATTLACPNTYVLRDANGRILAEGYDSPLSLASLGDTICGGELICKASAVAWIVAPNTSEVSRTWYCRNDANTRAQQVSGCTGWFVPTRAQLQNPGRTCRTYWDSYSGPYWSPTEYVSSLACFVNIGNGSSSFEYKTCTLCVRAFRCVIY